MDDTQQVKNKVACFFAAYPKVNYAKGEMIVHGYVNPTHVIYITAGLIQQYDITKNGAEVAVNIFKPGAFLPMSWALEKNPNRFFFEALTDVAAHIAPPADVADFLHDNPDVALDLLRRVYRGANGLLHRMSLLMGGSAEARLAFEIRNIAYRFGDWQQDGSIVLPFSESELAKQSGLSRETVSRKLQALKSAHIVMVLRGKLIVTNVQLLEKYLDSIE